MARQRKPWTSNASEPEPVTVPVPPAPTCGNCKHWRQQGDGFGLCVANPPTIASKPTAHGPLCLYPVTTEEMIACAKHEPK